MHINTPTLHFVTFGARKGVEQLPAARCNNNRRRDQQTARDNSIGFKVYKRSKQFSKQTYICLPRHLDRGSVLRSADWTNAETTSQVVKIHNTMG